MTHAETLRRFPKAELHVHLEGTVTPEMLFRLMRRHNIEVNDPIRLGETITIEPFLPHPHTPSFPSFRHFVRYYLHITRCLKTATDIHEVALAYLTNAKTESISQIQMYFTPLSYLRLGISLHEAFYGLIAAQQSAREHGINLTWIFDIVRNASPDGRETLNAARDARNFGVSVNSIGLAGDELTQDYRKFVDVFAESRADGFQTLAHIGETLDSAEMLECIRLLQPQRIGHALATLKSVALRETISQHNIILEVCPWSNILLGRCRREEHPIREFVRAELPVVLCSDDPGIFQKSLTDNYIFALDLGLTPLELQRIAERSLQA